MMTLQKYFVAAALFSVASTHVQAQLVPINVQKVKAADSATDVNQLDKKTITLKSGTVVVLQNPTLLADAGKVNSVGASPARVPRVDKIEPTVPANSVLNLPLATTPNKSLPQTQEVPGLGHIPGTAADYQIKSVRVGADRNELIYVSLQQLNKISTPFAVPSAVDTSGAVLKAIGQDIFFKPANDLPVTIYVSDDGVGQSIGITLVPKANLPAQSIVLVPDRAAMAGAAASASTPTMVAPDYTSRLIGLVRTLGTGALPQGYVKSRLPRSLSNDGKTIFEPLYKYVGSVYDVYSYSAKSASAEPVELNEESFFTESVRAVAFYPKVMLQQDESTTVYVVVDRDAIGAK